MNPESNREMTKGVEGLLGEEAFCFGTANGTRIKGDWLDNIGTVAALVSALVEQPQGEGYRRHIATVVLTALSGRFTPAELRVIAKTDTDHKIFLKWLTDVGARFEPKFLEGVSGMDVPAGTKLVIVTE